MYRPVCVGHGRIPRRPVFSRRGSNGTALSLSSCTGVSLLMCLHNLCNGPVNRSDSLCVTSGFSNDTIGWYLIANSTIGKEIGANGKNDNTIGSNGTNVTNQWYHWGNILKVLSMISLLMQQ